MLIEYKVLACMENNDVSMVLLESLEGSSMLIEIVSMLLALLMLVWPSSILGITVD